MPEELKSLDNGRYQLQEILGQGGMAVVYKAWDSRLRIERAIKILSPQVARRASLRKRFENEARTMARLAHPNIVSVTDVVEEGRTFFMVMELVTGGTLWDWVTRHGRMPSRLALEHLRPVLDAMGAAHAEGVIHRDIKPQNIMLTAEGKPKVTDFGIAHVQDLFNTGNLTRTGSVMGTWGYMAPEQRQSARDVDGRSDVYALGATLYALVTADLPVDLFAAAQDDEVLGRVPAELHQLVRKATRYRASDRYQDVAEMATAFDGALEALEPLPAGTPRLGADPDLKAAAAPTPATPAISATIGLEDIGEPPPRQTPIPLRTAAVSDETFDFDAVSDLEEPQDAPNPTAAPPLGPQTLAETPIHPQHHTAVPDTGGSDIILSTAPETVAPPRWRSPALVAALLLAVGLPGGWYALNRGAEPTPSEPGMEQPTPSPVIEVAAQPEPDAPEDPEEAAVADAEPPVPDEPVAEPAAPEPEPPTVRPEPARSQPRERVPEPEAAASPAPEPAAPEPEPTAVEPEPAAAPPALAIVSVSGEVEQLRLIDGSGKAWPPGQVPAGSYKIEALFPGRDAPIVAGKLELAPGQSHSLNCMPNFMKCK
jgi:serine/threonine protein kinase